MRMFLRTNRVLTLSIFREQQLAQEINLKFFGVKSLHICAENIQEDRELYPTRIREKLGGFWSNTFNVGKFG